VLMEPPQPLFPIETKHSPRHNNSRFFRNTRWIPQKRKAAPMRRNILMGPISAARVAPEASKEIRNQVVNLPRVSKAMTKAKHESETSKTQIPCFVDWCSRTQPMQPRASASRFCQHLQDRHIVPVSTRSELGGGGG